LPSYRLKKLWRTFRSARPFVQALHLASRQEWRDYIKGAMPHLTPLPANIPRSPQGIYRYHGWSGWHDWLGLPRKQRFRTFPAARIFARSLGLQSQKEWRDYCCGETLRGTVPDDIPRSPNVVYRQKGWISWYDWLGNAVVAEADKIYEPFLDARKFARGLGLRGAKDWFDFVAGKLSEKGALPDNIPSFPYRTYKNKGWRSWQDWLRPALPPTHLRCYRDYQAAKRFARSLHLKSAKEWLRYRQGELFNLPPLPEDIPSSPDRVYRGKGWRGWATWLGDGNDDGNREWRAFAEARAFVHALGLRNEGEWRAYCREELPGHPPCPLDIPTNPHRTYRKEWRGMGDWLGTGNISNRQKKFRAYRRAEAFAHALNLRNVKDWYRYCRGELPDRLPRPADIPGSPDAAYRHKGWINWGAFLGTGQVSDNKREFRPFAEAREHVRSLRILTCTDWLLYVKGKLPGKPPLPDDIPRGPDRAYQHQGWISWPDWLGNRRARGGHP
jgi:hypothetical protein